MYRVDASLGFGIMIAVYVQHRHYALCTCKPHQGQEWVRLDWGHYEGM